MTIYDISQPVFNCAVYPGDPHPGRQILCEIRQGDSCNLSAFTMCSHNGTHVDAPYHFFENGMRLCQMPLDTWIGPAFVARHTGEVSSEDALRMLAAAADADPEAARRILIRGSAVVTESAAEVFARARLKLLGNESQTVGPEDAPAQVHRILLGAEVALLEGIRLNNVPEGVYFLYAAPINLGEADGAPCRAVLTRMP